MKKIVLVTTGRTGSDFFQSLLDGHDQIISFPGVFYFDEFLKIKSNIAENFVKLYEKFFDSRLNIYERHNQLGKDKKDYYRVNSAEFIKFYNELKNYDESSEDNLLERLHLAYAKAKGEDLSKKKLIFLHIHHIDRINKIKSLNFDIIVTYRNPLANLSSAFNNWRKYKNGNFFSFRELKSYYDRLVNGINYLNKFEKKVFILKLEDLHVNSNKVIQKFCNVYGIEEKSLMYNSTFFNKKWWGDEVSGRFLDGINKNFKNDINMSFFFKKDLFYIEYLLLNLMKILNYEHFYKTKYSKISFFLPTKMEIILLKEQILKLNLLAPFQFFVNYIIRIKDLGFRMKTFKQLEIL